MEFCLTSLEENSAASVGWVEARTPTDTGGSVFGHCWKKPSDHALASNYKRAESIR